MTRSLRSVLFSLSTLALLLPGAARADAPKSGSISGTIAERGLRRTLQLVYVEQVPAGDATAPADNSVMGQKSNTFVPHILPIVAGTQVAFASSDPELHNIYAKGGEKVVFNNAVPAGSPGFKRTFNDPGVIALTCNIHSEMSAFIVVLQNKHFALVDPKTGEWKIEGVAPGTYTVRVWGEKLDAAFAAKKFPVTVTSGTATTLLLSQNPTSSL